MPYSAFLIYMQESVCTIKYLNALKKKGKCVIPSGGQILNLAEKY